MSRFVACLITISACSSSDEPMRITGFALPESALWDERADVYLVSNIGGDPRATDDDGFIARVDPRSGRVDRWIDGATEAVTLDAPRGMALAGDDLYVADLQTVRVFDRVTGAPRAAWRIPDAVMLNDIASGGGAVYVTDSGLPPSLQPAVAQHAIWKLAGDAAPEPVLRARDLGRPNGIAVRGAEVWVVTYASQELFRIDAADGAVDRERLPAGGLDGLIITDSGVFLVSSWDARAVLAGRPGGPWTPVVTGVTSPADIGWDARRSRVLIPSLEDGAFVVRRLSR